MLNKYVSFVWQIVCYKKGRATYFVEKNLEKKIVTKNIQKKIVRKKCVTKKLLKKVFLQGKLL